MACDLNLSETQRQMLAAAAAMLDADYPVSRLRTGAIDDLSKLAGFGSFTLAFPEENGGAGLSLVEEALLHTLLGRHLISAQAVAAAIGARLAAASGLAELAEKTAAGEAVIAAAAPSGGSILLIDPAGADTALVFAPEALTLLDISGQPGERLPGLGETLQLKRISRQSAARLGENRDARLRQAADLLISAQLLGIAEALRDLAVSYAKIRQQFGKPIGAFQAVKHHCADMAIAADMLSAQLDMAAIALADQRADAAFQVSALALLAPRAALANARACIQIHGGSGFSAEADAHLYLKQAHALRQLLSRSGMLEHAAPPQSLHG